MRIEFLATVAVVAPDPPASRRLYVDTLGLPLQSGGDGEYFHTGQLAGCKHFGVWPLHQAAQATRSSIPRARSRGARPWSASNPPRGRSWG
ncbi:MAG: hypothetical protein ACXVSA_18925 [Solirubrobacteraceae bacterium]